jgi:hypothetical protein
MPALSCASRAEVDEIVKKAIEASDRRSPASRAPGRRSQKRRRRPSSPG